MSAGTKLKPVDKIWLDGSLVPFAQANVHILTHTLHYGVGAFEGIRAYKRADGKGAIFRLAEHIDRLFESAHICSIEVPYTREQIAAACLDTMRANKMNEAYLRPLVFLGDGELGLGSLGNPVRVAVAVYEWGAYLGEEGLRRGIRAKVSSFTRGGLNSIMSKGKICGQYVNSVLAKREAIKAGYSEAILLDVMGQVAEASGENIFMMRKGKLRTPPLSSAILAGITRDTVIQLAREMGITVEESTFARDELYIADEVFFTGTAAELTPVREIDDRQIGAGECGPTTRKLQDAYFESVKGRAGQEKPLHPEWLTFV
ncbi:MAG TPA: branched-chain amino acid transaminase [Polyangia bacterium]|jgi:branched-chain amino acid aminotransferase|nr:branched-chain amino acid transaminase [Polyangia bacterium]